LILTLFDNSIGEWITADGVRYEDEWIDDEKILSKLNDLFCDLLIITLLDNSKGIYY